VNGDKKFGWSLNDQNQSLIKTITDLVIKQC